MSLRFDNSLGSLIDIPTGLSVPDFRVIGGDSSFPGWYDGFGWIDSEPWLDSIYQYSFDGIDDYGSIPPITLEGDFEISLYATSDIDGTNMTLGDTGDGNTWGFYRLGGGTTIVRLGYRDGTFLNASVNFKVPVGESAEYKVTRIGTAVNFYINNQIVATSTTVIKPVVIDTVGARGVAAQNFWNGNIKNAHFRDLSNPSNSRLYKINEGPGSDVMIDSLSTNGSTNGTYVNFNDERWENV